MRILHLVHRTWPYHGGAERYVLEHALAGVRRGHECTILSTDAWDMSWLVSRRGGRISRKTDTVEGVRIHRVRAVHPPLQNLFRAVLRRLAPCGKDRFYYPNPFVPGLRPLLETLPRFDVVHANAMPFMLHRGWDYCRRHGAALVSVPHANVGEKYRRVSALSYFDGCQPGILRQSSLTVAQSPFERDLFMELGVPGERILVLGSGIDPSEFAAADPVRGRASLGLEGPVILCMTAQTVDRGTEHLLAACRLVAEAGVRFTLVLAGPVMPDAEEIIAGAAGSAIGDRLVVTGRISRRERVDLIAGADMVVLPSRLDCFGIVLLEAWVTGKPVIGCWSGAMPDLISEANGLVTSWGDVPALASAVQHLVHHPAAGRKMGSEGRRKVLAEHTWTSVTDRFYRRLAEVTSGEGRWRK